jgi:hypothetical protein
MNVLGNEERVHQTENQSDGCLTTRQIVTTSQQSTANLIYDAVDTGFFDDLNNLKFCLFEIQTCLLGCTAVKNNCRPTFQRYVLPPPSGR